MPLIRDYLKISLLCLKMMTDKLKRLEENLRILSNFKKNYTLEDVIADKVEGLFTIDGNFYFYLFTL